MRQTTDNKVRMGILFHQGLYARLQQMAQVENKRVGTYLNGVLHRRFAAVTDVEGYRISEDAFRYFMTRDSTEKLASPQVSFYINPQEKEKLDRLLYLANQRNGRSRDRITLTGMVTSLIVDELREKQLL